MDYLRTRTLLDSQGFDLIPHLYSETEVQLIITEIDALSNHQGAHFLKSNQLFAIRHLFQTAPKLAKCVLKPTLLELVRGVGGDEYFLTKALYFDKPAASNWFVAYHQDLSIHVAEKADVPGFTNWTQKRGMLGVLPPISVLENTLTVRIHLDDTDGHNGALKVLPGSHMQGVATPPEQHNKEYTCEVKKGGILLMKPLLFHASSRSTTAKRRRVIHLEFCNKELPPPLTWAEKMSLLQHQNPK